MGSEERGRVVGGGTPRGLPPPGRGRGIDSIFFRGKNPDVRARTYRTYVAKVADEKGLGIV